MLQCQHETLSFKQVHVFFDWKCIEAVNNDFDKTFSETFSEKKKLPINNLSDSDKKAVEYFLKRYDPNITKVDKGGATTIR